MAQMIPVVDCQNEDFHLFNTVILDAIWGVGFVYLKNCGIDNAVVADAFKASESFFQSPFEVKEECCPSGVNNWGYVRPGVEILSPDKTTTKTELRESFNVTRTKELSDADELWPASLPDFKPAVELLWDQCGPLAVKLLKIIGGKLDDNNVLLKSHLKMGTEENSTAIRLIHYPPVPEDFVEDAPRCGEHTDYGSLTLLFQDQVGGLEVQNVHGEFVKAEPVEGAVLVNTGDLLENWSGGAVKAVRHRVRLPPPSSPQRGNHRYSIACFVHPDKEVIIKPLDGSSKYPATTDQKYLNEQFSKTYFR